MSKIPTMPQPNTIIHGPDAAPSAPPTVSPLPSAKPSAVKPTMGEALENQGKRLCVDPGPQTGVIKTRGTRPAGTTTARSPQALSLKLAQALSASPHDAQSARLSVLAAFAPADNDAIKGEFKTNYKQHALAYAALTTSQLTKSTEQVGGSGQHMQLARALLENVVTATTTHFASGKFDNVSDAQLNEAALKQHAGYVAGEIGRKFGIPTSVVRNAILPFLRDTANQNTTTEQRKTVARSIISAHIAASHAPIGPEEGRELSHLAQQLEAFTGSDDAGYMFNQWGFGDADKALNRPGVYAGQATKLFADALAGGQSGGKELLKRALNRSAQAIASGLAAPKTNEDLVTQFAARAAQAGWLTAKTGQGIVEAEKGKDGTKRFAPKNDLVTDFDTLALNKGWAEVAKDLDQVETSLWGLGVSV